MYHQPYARLSTRTLYFDLRVQDLQDVLARLVRRCLYHHSVSLCHKIAERIRTRAQGLHQLKISDPQLPR